MERDIIERLMDFDRCGLTAGERVNLRECAAVEIHQLRQENEKYRKTLEVIAGSADKLQATQALGALTNIGAALSRS